MSRTGATIYWFIDSVLQRWLQGAVLLNVCTFRSTEKLNSDHAYLKLSHKTQSQFNIQSRLDREFGVKSLKKQSD